MTRQGNPRKKKKAVGIRKARSSPDHRVVGETESSPLSEGSVGAQSTSGEESANADQGESPASISGTLGPPPTGVTYELALDSHGHEGQLQDLFFQKGLDEAHLASHGADHDHFKAPPRWNRLAIGIGAVGLLGVVVLAMSATGKSKKHGVQTSAVATAATKPEAHATPPARPPEPAQQPTAMAAADAGSQAALPVSMDAGPVNRTTESVATTPQSAQPEAAFSPFVLDDTAVQACKNAYRKQQYGTVVKLCGTIIDNDATPAVTPESIELTSFVAHAFLLTNKLKEASATATKLIAVAPDHAFAYVVLGMAEQERGKPREARKAYTRYLELEPKGAYAADLRAVLRGL